MSKEIWNVKKIVNLYKNESTKYLEVSSWRKAWTWTDKKGIIKMQSLIESILSEFDIGSIELIEKPDTDYKQYLINDGRHRIETLTKFINNEFPIIVGSYEKYFKDLSNTTQESILQYNIEVIILDYNISYNKKSYIEFDFLIE